MELVELLQSVKEGPLSFQAGSQEFSDVLDLIDGPASGAFKEVKRTITTPRDGEIGHCTGVEICGLSSIGAAILLDLEGGAIRS